MIFSGPGCFPENGIGKRMGSERCDRGARPWQTHMTRPNGEPNLSGSAYGDGGTRLVVSSSAVALRSCGRTRTKRDEPMSMLAAERTSLRAAKFIIVGIAHRIDYLRHKVRGLTEPQLEKLGMPLGHRIRLLKAISNLEASEKSAVAVAPAPEPLPTAHATGPPTPEAVGERRHITVMFCDLVDSTGIAARLDAEEWRDLVGAYLDAAKLPGCSSREHYFVTYGK
jgi:hypothetical protein